MAVRRAVRWRNASHLRCGQASSHFRFPQIHVDGIPSARVIVDSRLNESCHPLQSCNWFLGWFSIFPSEDVVIAYFAYSKKKKCKYCRCIRQTNLQSIVYFVDKWPLFVTVCCLLKVSTEKNFIVWVCVIRSPGQTCMRTEHTMCFFQFKRGSLLQD